MLSRDDKEFQKFETDSNGNQAVRVIGVDQGSLLSGLSFDYIAATYPTATSEVYTYKTGGSGGTTVATITVTYSDSTKEQVTSVERS